MNAFLLLLATFGLQVVTSSVVQHQDAMPFENNFKAEVNPIRIEEKNLVTINGTRYYFSLLDATLYEAQTTCADVGMDLLSLETQAESDSVWAYIQADEDIVNTSYYTSGVKVNSQFKWSNSYLNYNNWAPGEPDLPGTTNQACIYYGSGRFYDEGCTSSLRFICEERVAC